MYQHADWNCDLKYSDGELILDADNCPECGSPIFNTVFRQTAQFVGMTNPPEGLDIENGFNGIDDGPWNPELEFIRCGACTEILYDEDGDGSDLSA